MKKTLVLLTCLLMFTTVNAQREIIYRVYVRSFYDSNADGQGDLEGVRQNLEYFYRLGVTSIMLTPLYDSGFYHNRFADDFRAVDNEYGMYKNFYDLLKEVHLSRMKLYIDVEPQYVSGRHNWFADSYKNPSSEFSEYILYKDKGNSTPYYFKGEAEYLTCDGKKEQVVAVNLNSDKVKEYTVKNLKYWADPNGDGSFEDGIDGFRVGNMADTEGPLKNLLKDFWNPVIAELKKLNPDLNVIAAQKDEKSYGDEYFNNADVDRVYAYNLREAILSFNKEKIMAVADSTFNRVQQANSPIVFIENHDTSRFASLVSEPGQLRVGAALNLLMGGVPCIYYGQELGMKGVIADEDADGNDIPAREAFEWYASGDGKGMAYWYKDAGKFWEDRAAKPNDGISAEEQRENPKSLWNYYKELIKLRRMQSALRFGNYANEPNSNDKVLAFSRSYEDQKIFVMINLSPNTQFAQVENNYLRLDRLRLLSGDESVAFKKGGRLIALPAYAVQVWRLLN